MPTTADSTAVTETHPPHKTTLTAQTLLQQVQLNMHDDSEEGSDGIADEADGNPSEDLNDSEHGYSSDGKIGDITLGPTDQLTIVATLNKKPVPVLTPCGSRKTPQVPLDPQVDDSTDEDDSDDGEALFFITYYCTHNEWQNLFR